MPKLAEIENNKSKISIITLVRLLYALDISFSSIFTDKEIQVDSLKLNIYNKMKISRGNPPKYPCINFNDVELLDTQGIVSSGKIKEVTISLLQQYIQKFDTELDEKSTRILAEQYYKSLGEKNELALMVPGLTPGEMPSPMEYVYPREFSGAKLRQIYLSGGCLIFLDIGMYIRQVRLSKDLSLRELGKMVGISHQGIKFIETRTAEKLIFDDLVRLDQALDLGGDLITFSWRATEIYTGAFRLKNTREQKLHPFPPNEILEIEKLIIASRFFQYFLPDDPSWIEWLRKISLQGFRSKVT